MEPTAHDVRIVAIGAVSPLGLSALQTAMGVRARRLCPAETPYRDRRGRTVGLCVAGVAGFDVIGYERLLCLAASALVDTVGLAPEGTWPAVVALPDCGRPDDDPAIASSFIDDLSRASGVAL